LRSTIGVPRTVIPINLPSPPPPETDDSIPNEKRFVYFVEEEGTGRIKIGVTKNIIGRLRQLQTHTSSELKLLVQVEVPDAFKIERCLHTTFSNLKVRGEWFSSEIVWFPEALIKITDAIDGHQECPLCTYDTISTNMVVNRDECTMSLLCHIISSIPSGQRCEKHGIED
jgi:hypothetical protein